MRAVRAFFILAMFIFGALFSYCNPKKFDDQITSNRQNAIKESKQLHSSTKSKWLRLGPYEGRVMCCAINPQGDIFVGTWCGGIFRSRDEGKTWIPCNNGLHFYERKIIAITISPNGHIFVVLAQALYRQVLFNTPIYRSTNNGASWKMVYRGIGFPVRTPITITSLASNSRGHIFAGGCQGVLRSIDNGAKWTFVNKNCDVLTLAINSQNHIFAGTMRGVFRSLNNGVSWVAMNKGIPKQPKRERTTGCIWRSKVAPKRQRTPKRAIISLLVSPNQDIFALTGHTDDKNILVSKEIFRSTNNGKTWELENKGISGRVVSMAINSRGNVFSVTEDGKIFRTANGKNWTSIKSRKNLFLHEFLAVSQKDKIIAASRHGIHMSKNDGGWEECNNGLS